MRTGILEVKVQSFPKYKVCVCVWGGGYAPLLLVCHENVTEFECLGGREE